MTASVWLMENEVIGTNAIAQPRDGAAAVLAELGYARKKGR